MTDKPNENASEPGVSEDAMTKIAEAAAWRVIEEFLWGMLLIVCTIGMIVKVGVRLVGGPQ